MIKHFKRIIATTVTPLDLYAQRHNRGKLKIGWCSAYPPTPNGAASVTYHFLEKLMQNEDLDVYAIPLGGRIEKRLFKGIKFADLNNKRLDAVVFFCLGPEIENALKKTRAKKIAWQTAHDKINENLDEKTLFECLKGVDVIITLTKDTRLDYLENGAQKVEYVPAGVNISKFLPSKDTNKQVLFTGRVHYYKGIVAYLETIPLVLKHDNKVKFRLHGPIDTNTNHLSEILTLLDKTKREFSANFVYDGSWVDYEKIYHVYDDSDICVFPSDNEGFGVPMVEAMSCGIPCIVTDKPPMNEIVKNNETGFCLPIRNNIGDRYHGYRFPHPQDIADKILFLMNNRSELKRMSDNARSRVETEYNIDECANKMIRIIKEAIAN